MTRIAIAHDYLTQRGGAERVVLAMARAFPDAPIYTTFYDPETTYPEFAGLEVRTAPVNRWRWLRRHHRAALPLMPLISSAIKVDADVVLVSSSGWAHGFRTKGPSLVYCHSPARWIYQSEVYLGQDSSRIVQAALAVLKPILRRWDTRVAMRSGDYVSNSTVVRERIRAVYGKEAIVVPPPQMVNSSEPAEPIAGLDSWLDGHDFYLCVSRLLPYKNVGEIITAMGSKPERRLVIVGAGPDEDRLHQMASGNVLFLKDLTDGQMRTAYARCRALVAASYEDFGLTPLEAASFGRPCAVLRWGGFLDTMVEGVTAVFFDTPTADAIGRGLEELETIQWDADNIRAHAGKFSETTFAATLNRMVKKLEQEAHSR